MSILKWIRTHTHPANRISVVEMVHTDLCETVHDIIRCTDTIDNVSPACLKRDTLKIESLHNHLDELCSTRDSLRNMKRVAIAAELNRFPLNTPCTITHISNAVGIVGYEVEAAMMRSTTHYSRSDVDEKYPAFKHLAYKACISPDGTHSLEDRYENGERCIHDVWRVRTLKISGWRFVLSEFGHLYIERFD